MNDISVYGSLLEGRECERQELRNAIRFYISFREKIDPERMQLALDTALTVCPYIAYIPVRRNGFISYESCEKALKLSFRMPERLGEEETGGHYSVVLCRDSSLEIYVSHGICDAEAVTWFVDALLCAYFGSNSHYYRGFGNPDYSIDLMAQKLPVPEDYLFTDYTKSPAFTFPEAKEAVPDRYCLLSSEREQFRALCRRMKCSATVAVVWLLFSAVQKCYPGNTDWLTCKTPVSTRKNFGAENSFQNASVPNIVFSYEGSRLLQEDPAKAAARLDREKSEQTDPARLAYITNSLASFCRKESGRDAVSEILKINGQSMLVSCIKGCIPACADEHIAAFQMSSNVMCPLGLYVTYTPGKVFFGFTSTFDADKIIDMFAGCLNEAGIGCEPTETFKNG